MDAIIHSLEHALTESLKILPFLIVAFLVLEFIETKFEEKSSNVIQKANHTGPVLGALLGLAPQCGFSVIGSNFYAKRIISLGTLLAIYLSTSDEALLVLLATPDKLLDILLIIAIKLVIAVFFGYAIDLVIRRETKKEECHHCHHHDDSCEDEEIIGEEHCCSHTDWKAIIKCTAKRTVSVWCFLLATTFVFEYVVGLIGEAKLQEFMLTDSVFQPLITALIGLIPTCAPSVILAQLYIDSAISLGSVIAGLCTAAGAGLIVLFRVNKGARSNLTILVLLYLIGAFSGIVIELVQGFLV